MTKYENMSDLSLEEAIAHKLEINWYLSPSDHRNTSGGWYYSEFKWKREEVSLPNYLTDWSLVGEVIKEYNISLLNYCEDEFIACTDFQLNDTEHSELVSDWRMDSSHSNPLRAIWILFLNITDKSK